MRGQGRVFERGKGKVPWIAYFQNGRELRESAAPAVKVEEFKKRRPLARDEALGVAHKLLQRRLREVANDSLGLQAFVGPKQYKTTVGELLDVLEADLKLRNVGGLAGILSHLKRVRGPFGDRRAVSITTDAVDRYIESRLSEKDPPAHATINRETGLLGQAFKLGVERQRIATAPKIRKLSERGNARQGFFEADAYAKVAEALPEHLKGFVQFAYYSGWRRGEIASEQWSDVDMLGRTIRLRPEHSKTREGRVLSLAGELWPIITRQWALREFEKGRKGSKTKGVSEYVFHRKGEPIGEFRKAWAEACKAAGVEGKLFHDFRRTAVRNMIRAGTPERMAMAVSGHKTTAMLYRYAIVREDDLKDALERTQRFLTAAAQRGGGQGAGRESKPEAQPTGRVS